MSQTRDGVQDEERFEVGTYTYFRGWKNDSTHRFGYHVPIEHGNLRFILNS